VGRNGLLRQQTECQITLVTALAAVRIQKQYPEQGLFHKVLSARSTYSGTAAIRAGPVRSAPSQEKTTGSHNHISGALDKILLYRFLGILAIPQRLDIWLSALASTRVSRQVKLGKALRRNGHKVAVEIFRAQVNVAQ
jgi:hypothetical protein